MIAMAAGELDQNRPPYQTLRLDMQTLFNFLGISTKTAVS